MSDEIAPAPSADFASLVGPHLPALHSFAYRMVAHPEDARDIVQETLLAAHQNVDRFRGDATFRTWVFSIATRKCIDHLRARKRWAANAQSAGAQAHVNSPELMDKIKVIVEQPGFRYEYREHIAYCFSCVGRSLPPVEAAAVLLREVFEFTNDESASLVGLSVSTFRHRLASGRAQMIATFEDRCALVGKQGVCWQCEALRTHLPEDRQGAEVESLRTSNTDSDETLFARRLAIVGQVQFGQVQPGALSTQALHDYFLRYMNELADG